MLCFARNVLPHNISPFTTTFTDTISQLYSYRGVESHGTPSSCPPHTAALLPVLLPVVCCPQVSVSHASPSHPPVFPCPRGEELRVDKESVPEAASTFRHWHARGTKAMLSPEPRMLEAETVLFHVMEYYRQGICDLSQSRVDAQVTDEMVLKGRPQGCDVTHP